MAIQDDISLPGAFSDSELMALIHLSTSSLDDPANCHTDPFLPLSSGVDNPTGLRPGWVIDGSKSPWGTQTCSKYRAPVPEHHEPPGGRKHAQSTGPQSQGSMSPLGTQTCSKYRAPVPEHHEPAGGHKHVQSTGPQSQGSTSPQGDANMLKVD